MKKMKKALFAVIAAFSLSACDFDIASLPSQVADTVSGWTDSIKDLIPGAKKEEEKKEEELPCDHKDANHDGVCDLCGVSGLDVKHSDDNKDHKCDVCGKELSQHADENKDHKCDYCGETISQHADDNKDHKCDICGEKVSDHIDGNKDHLCDICGTKLSEHADEDKDHKCDVCGATLSDHTDANHDGVCDYCGATGLDVQHVDSNHDGVCDVCGTEGLAIVHSDENADFVCDGCGKQLEFTAALDTSSVQKEFALGEKFNSNGLKVIATSEAGSTKELEGFSVSAPDMSTVGEKTVVVTYGEGENDKLEYTISVLYWSEMDLAVFSADSLTKYAPLPYMLGHNMRVEYKLDESGYLVDWAIVADDVDDKTVLAYNNALLDYEEVVELGGYDVTFKLEELPIDPDELVDIADEYELVEVLSAYYLIPSLVYEENEHRYFNIDEYFLLGVNEEGQMVIKNRMNNCAFDGMFDPIVGITRFDGSFSLIADSDLLQLYGEVLKECMSYYYSEFAPELVIFPEAGVGEDAFEVNPANLFTEYPFDSSFDDATLALEFTVWDTAQEDLDAYFAALLQAGYEYDAESGSYSIGNELAGYIQIFGAFKSVEYEGEIYSWYVFDLFYFAPEEYITVLHPAIYDLLEKLEISEYELDDYWYEQYEEMDVYFELEAEEATEEKSSDFVTLESLAAQLGGIGFEATSELTAGSSYSYASFTDYANINISVYVSEPEDGVCEVVIEVTKYYSYTLEDVVKAIFGEVEPEEIEGNYSAVMLPYEEGETPSADGLEAIIVPAAESAEKIADIDYDILAGEGYYYFSALTKDEKFVFTVYAYPGLEGYTLELEVEELGNKEALVRDTLSLFSQVGPVRYANYSIALDGSVSTQLVFASGAEETIIYYIEFLALPEDFEAVGDPEPFEVVVEAEEEGEENTVLNGTMYTYSNGAIDYVIKVIDDGESTTFNITVSDTAVED